MRFLLKYILLLVLFFYSVIAFLPKENLYYLLEGELFKNKVIISNEEIKDNFLSFNLNKATVYYNDIEFSTFEKLNLDLFIFKNEFKVKNILISEQFTNFVPQKIDFINILYTIQNPKVVTINSEGQFGILEGFVDILDRKIILKLNASKEMKQKSSQLLKFMKFDKGVYSYEYKF